jgi:hypothetical protein
LWWLSVPVSASTPSMGKTKKKPYRKSFLHTHHHEDNSIPDGNFVGAGQMFV